LGFQEGNFRWLWTYEPARTTRIDFDKSTAFAFVIPSDFDCQFEVNHKRVYV